MASCGNKTAKGGDNDSTVVADSVVAAAPAELWTVEAVEAQVRKIYDRLNDMDKNGIINIRRLEDEFCSSYYLGLRDAISKTLTEAMGDDHFFMPASDQVITYFDAWLYDPQTGKFNHHEGFRDIANPEVDTVNA